MPKAGLELAVLDAALRAEGRSLGEYLGAERDRVPSGVSVGLQADPAALVEAVGGYLDEGYVRIKIKIKPGRDVGDTAAVRDAFGAIPLQVDANSAYTLADVDALERARPVRPAADRAAAAGGRPRRPRDPRASACARPCASTSRSSRSRRRPTRSPSGRRRSSTSRPDGSAATSRRCASTTWRAAPACRCGAAACSRPASAAPPTRRSRRCRASRCRATSRRHRASTPATSSPSPRCSRTGTCACPPAPGIGVEIDHDALEEFTVARETVRR